MTVVNKCIERTHGSFELVVSWLLQRVAQTYTRLRVSLMFSIIHDWEGFFSEDYVFLHLISPIWRSSWMCEVSCPWSWNAYMSVRIASANVKWRPRSIRLTVGDVSIIIWAELLPDTHTSQHVSDRSHWILEVTKSWPPFIWMNQ